MPINRQQAVLAANWLILLDELLRFGRVNWKIVNEYGCRTSSWDLIKLKKTTLLSFADEVEGNVLFGDAVLSEIDDKRSASGNKCVRGSRNWCLHMEYFTSDWVSTSLLPGSILYLPLFFFNLAVQIYLVQIKHPIDIHSC